MTLNKTQTALAKTAIDAEASFFYWLKNDTTNISNNEYDSIKSDFATWADAYDNGELYGTHPNGDTFQFSGITQMPIPPSR